MGERHPSFFFCSGGVHLSSAVLNYNVFIKSGCFATSVILFVVSVPLRLPATLLPGCSSRTEWSPCGKEAERPDRGRTGLWPFPLSEGLSPESPSVWAGWTLGVGWEYRRGAKVPANHSLTTGKVLASRKPKKMQFRRQRPQRSRIGAASVARPPAKFLSPHRHLDDNADWKRRCLDFYGKTTETVS